MGTQESARSLSPDAIFGVEAGFISQMPAEIVIFLNSGTTRSRRHYCVARASSPHLKIAQSHSSSHRLTSRDRIGDPGILCWRCLPPGT
jgi:hypothetical protein